MSVNIKMTAIANEIRELSGISEVMGLDAMAENLSEANSEVSYQESLIAQIASALKGKAAGGSGGGGVETCTVTIDISEDTFSLPFLCFLTTIESGIVRSHYVSESSVFSNVIKNSDIFLIYPEGGRVFIQTGDWGANEYYPAMFSEDGMAMAVKKYQLLYDNNVIEVY